MASVPVLVQVLFIFTLIVIANARRVHLGLAAVLGGLVFGLFRGFSLGQAVLLALAELFRLDTVFLLLLVTGIMVFSSAMKNIGALRLFADALLAVIPSPRIALAVAPLLIGTLPMPGGAILSAPLVESFDPEHSRSRAALSAANFWFRHSLELAWPLYPAFILTTTLSGLSVGSLSLLNLYSLPLLFSLGLVFIIPRIRRQPARRAATEGGWRSRLRVFLRGLAPLLLVLGTYAGLDLLWRSVGAWLDIRPDLNALIQRYAWIYCGLLAGGLYLRYRPGGARAFKGSLNLSTLKLAGVIAGIRVFSAMLSAGGVAEAAGSELAAIGIPALAAAALLPFISGLVTGVGFGYVGLAFPLVLGLFPAGGSMPQAVVVVLAGAFGYAGMMLSPLHVCMVVTAAHFGTGLLSTIRRFALPLCGFLVLATAYSYLLYRFLV